MSLKDDNARFALLKAIVDAATAELVKFRTQHVGVLLERFDDDGTSSFKAMLPDGTVVATISLAVPSPELKVKDETAFQAWVESHHPEAIDTETVPAQPEKVLPAVPERVEKSINGKKLTVLMERFKATTEGVVDLDTGALVDGVQMTTPRPKQFAVTYAKDGRELLADEYRAGKLDHLVAGTSLPMLGLAERAELEG